MNTTHGTATKRLVAASGMAAAGKKFLATVGLALGVGSLGVIASAGTATADAYGILDPDGTFGASDVPEVRDWDLNPAVHSYVTSSWPAPSSWPGHSFLWGVGPGWH